jgi:6-phosphogluconolactonase
MSKGIVLGAALAGLFALIDGCGGGGGGSAAPPPTTATYTVTYLGNGNTSGSVPIDSASYAQGTAVTLLGNTGSLARTGYAFAGWNTQANGGGTSYATGSSCTMGVANLTFYAQWTASTATVLGYAYVANQYEASSAGISQYTIGPDGTLTANTPATVACGKTPVWVTVHPTGKYVYVANEQDQVVAGTWACSISQYTVGSDGGLTPMATDKVLTGGVYPRSMVITPDGRFLYVVNIESSIISQFSIGGDGALTALSPATAACDTYAVCLAMAPGGTHLYVCSTRNGVIQQYAIGPDGQLTLLTPSSVTAGDATYLARNLNLQAITVSPAGSYAYVVDHQYNQVWQFNIGTGGLLSAMSSPRVAVGTGTGSALAITLDPAGKYCYVGSSATPAAAVWQYTVGPAGALTPMGTPSVASGTYNGAAGVTVDSTGTYLYAADGNPGNLLSQYRIGSDGSLTPLSPATVSTGAGPFNVAVYMK